MQLIFKIILIFKRREKILTPQSAMYECTLPCTCLPIIDFIILQMVVLTFPVSCLHLESTKKTCLRRLSVTVFPGRINWRWRLFTECTASLLAAQMLRGLQEKQCCPSSSYSLAGECIYSVAFSVAGAAIFHWPQNSASSAFHLESRDFQGILQACSVDVSAKASSLIDWAATGFSDSLAC